jgi:hypothetical protein
MPPNREYLRTPTDAASTARRFGHDFKLAARLHAQGLNPYKGQMPVFLVDLATEGSLTEPRGVPLRHSKLFNTQAAVSAFEFQRDIEAFDAAYRPDNVVHLSRWVARRNCSTNTAAVRSPICVWLKKH